MILPRQLSASIALISGLVFFVLAPSAFAQAPAPAPANDPCAKLSAVMQERVQIIDQVQRFKEKKPTAAEACTVFTKLSAVNKKAVEGLERDGAWCRAPDTFAASLKQQQPQIDDGKTNACKAAAQQKKMQNQQGAGGQSAEPFGGTGDVLGGPLKLPQGAL